MRNAPFQRLLREPLFHFLLIGGAVFWLYTAATPAAVTRSAERIEVSEAHAEQLANGFRAVWQRPPTEAELRGLIDSWIREEVLVREATKLSMDQNDEVIRQRLAQKMTFLMQSAGAAIEPDDDALRMYFEENADRYVTPGLVGFEQVFLGSDADSAAVEKTLAALERGDRPDALGQPTLLPQSFPLAPRRAVDGTFGDGFFDRVASLEPGVWAGPVDSGYGLHIVRVQDVQEPGNPDFETVRDRVSEDWRRGQVEESVAAQYQRLLDGYEVIRPGPADLREAHR